MIYLTQVEPGEMFRFLAYDGVPVVIHEPVEITVHATVSFEDIKDKPGAAIQEATENAQEDLADAFCGFLQKTAGGSEDVVVMLRENIRCLCADQLPLPFYDQDLEWDEDLGTLVVPEDAVITGWTKPKVGWVYRTTLVATAVGGTPQGDHWQTFGHPPMWIRTPHMDNEFGDMVLTAVLKSGEGRNRLAFHFGDSVGIGEKPGNTEWVHERWPRLGV